MKIWKRVDTIFLLRSAQKFFIPSDPHDVMLFCVYNNFFHLNILMIRKIFCINFLCFMGFAVRFLISQKFVQRPPLILLVDKQGIFFVDFHISMAGKELKQLKIDYHFRENSRDAWLIFIPFWFHIESISCCVIAWDLF